MTNLTKAIDIGGNVQALADAIRERDARLRTIDKRLSNPVQIPDRDVLRGAELRTVEWRAILSEPKHLLQARLVLQHLIDRSAS